MTIRGKIHNLRARIYRFILFKLKFCYSPFCFLFSEFDKLGVTFPWKSDTVIWLWPWHRKERKERFISIEFSGTGEWGDAVFNSLAEIDKNWKEYFETCQIDEKQEYVDI